VRFIIYNTNVNIQTRSRMS